MSSIIGRVAASSCQAGWSACRCSPTAATQRGRFPPNIWNRRVLSGIYGRFQSRSRADKEEIPAPAIVHTGSERCQVRPAFGHRIAGLSASPHPIACAALICLSCPSAGHGFRRGGEPPIAGGHVMAGPNGPDLHDVMLGHLLRPIWQSPRAAWGARIRQGLIHAPTVSDWGEKQGRQCIAPRASNSPLSCRGPRAGSHSCFLVANAVI